MNLNKFWKKRSVTITEYDPTYKVVYLGNVLTSWAKGDGCVDKPLATLWKNYCQSVKQDVYMKVTVCNSGLKAVTKEHGLTEYWSHRITYCTAHLHYPKVFCWVYRHEGKKMRQELRCHAVLCAKEDTARRMASELQLKLVLALQEFKREKICRQNARLSLANSVYDNPSLPRRKILLSTGTINYRPPLERSKSAPKLMVIEEVGEIGELLEEACGEREGDHGGSPDTHHQGSSHDKASVAASIEMQRQEERYQRQFTQLLQRRLLLHQRYCYQRSASSEDVAATCPPQPEDSDGEHQSNGRTSGDIGRQNGRDSGRHTSRGDVMRQNGRADFMTQNGLGDVVRQRNGRHDNSEDDDFDVLNVVTAADLDDVTILMNPALDDEDYTSDDIIIYPDDDDESLLANVYDNDVQTAVSMRHRRNGDDDLTPTPPSTSSSSSPSSARNGLRCHRDDGGRGEGCGRGEDDDDDSSTVSDESGYSEENVFLRLHRLQDRHHHPLHQQYHHPHPGAHHHHLERPQHQDRSLSCKTCGNSE